MKNSLRRFAAAAAAIVLLLLSGCRTLDIFSVDSLIRPPKLTGENARIQRVFEEEVGADVTLINPLLGEYRSAFVFFDLDGDDANETIVFYARNDAPSEVRMHFMDHNGDEWFSVADIAGNGSEVYRVEFCNIDADALSEIAVTWTLSDSKRNRTLSVYKCSADAAAEQRVVPLSALQILDYLILDFDFDGQKEILYLYSDTSVQTQLIKAALIKLDPEQQSFVPVSDVELSHSIEYPLNVCYDMVDGVYRAYFDCISFDDTYITELLVFDPAGAALIRPQDENGEYLCLRTVRNVPLLCTNVYGGSLVDMPVLFPHEGSRIYDSENDVASQLYAAQYVNYKNGALSPASSVFFYDEADGYSIRLDDFTADCRFAYNTVQRAFIVYRNGEETPWFSVNFNVADPESEPYRIVIFTSDGEEAQLRRRIRNDLIPIQR